MLDAGQAQSALLEQLTETERQKSVVYVLASISAQGTVLSFPKQTINVPSDALVAYIDQDPHQLGSCLPVCSGGTQHGPNLIVGSSLSAIWDPTAIPNGG